MRLGRLQKWMQAVVVHPGTTRQALRSPEAARHLAAAKLQTVLLPSPTLTPAERIAIYQEMYPLRMRDALAADYPGLEHFLGDRFPEFVAAYAAVHPSRGYTLNRLGDHVPAFLGRQRRLTPRAFLVDLARLELALTEAFDEQESPALDAGAIAAIPEAKIESTRLIPVPSLRLVALNWNADEWLDTLRDDLHRHPRPHKRRSFVLAMRRNYALYRLPLSEAGFCVLQDIVAGHPLGEVVTRSLSRRGAKRASADDFARWFRLWTSEGVFAGIRKGAGSKKRA
ncbi:MAG: putative DNA-binding domain-containing protein [Vicinamibacteria bacterium]|jgi:hypothetical protein|nr:putative DNA-binding domain-containing protein [Vicinamibacteria bacterium]